MRNSAIHEPLVRASSDLRGQGLAPVDNLWKQSLDDPEETHAFSRLVRRAVQSVGPRRVLDVGCGSGIPTIEAARAAAPRVLGIDLAPRNVFLARHNIRVAGLEACVTAHLASWRDVLLGDFSPGEVDLVVSNPPYVPAGDGSAVDGGAKGTRLLLSIIDGLPSTGRGVALLFGSLSDPLHVLAHLEHRGYRASRLFAESVPFGRYTSAPRTLAALKRLRASRSAWFFDTGGSAKRRADLVSAPHSYLRLGVIAERSARTAQCGVTPLGCTGGAAGARTDDTQRKLASLLGVYQRCGPEALGDVLRIRRAGQGIEPL